jgi:endogenous inhibitor of DNA gyrase (YacG/DUF329 family)
MDTLRLTTPTPEDGGVDCACAPQGVPNEKTAKAGRPCAFCATPIAAGHGTAWGTYLFCNKRCRGAWHGQRLAYERTAINSEARRRRLEALLVTMDRLHALRSHLESLKLPHLHRWASEGFDAALELRTELEFDS